MHDAYDIAVPILAITLFFFFFFLSVRRDFPFCYMKWMKHKLSLMPFSSPSFNKSKTLSLTSLPLTTSRGLKFKQSKSPWPRRMTNFFNSTHASFDRIPINCFRNIQSTLWTWKMIHRTYNIPKP